MAHLLYQFNLLEPDVVWYMIISVRCSVVDMLITPFLKVSLLSARRELVLCSHDETNNLLDLYVYSIITKVTIIALLSLIMKSKSITGMNCFLQMKWSWNKKYKY